MGRPAVSPRLDAGHPRGAHELVAPARPDPGRVRRAADLPGGSVCKSRSSAIAPGRARRGHVSATAAAQGAARRGGGMKDSGETLVAEVFASGTHLGRTWTTRDLDTMVSNH